MADINIPLRPKVYDKSIKRFDADILTYSVLFGTSNYDAYVRFHPEYKMGIGNAQVGKAEAKQFFQYAKHREYIDAYIATLEEFLNGKRERSKSFDVDDNRKDKALKALLSRAMSLVEENDSLDPDTLKTLTEIFRKTGILKDEVEVQEAPRRYLPATCNSCEYKKFIDEQVELGNIEKVE